MEAVGAYLWKLREARGFTRLQVAKKLDTTDAQLGRIEKGEIDTRGSFLFEFLDLVQGNAEQLRQLMRNPHATATDGSVAATAWLQEQRSRMQGEPEEVRRQAAYIYRRLAELIEGGQNPSDALRLVESELQQRTQGHE